MDQTRLNAYIRAIQDIYVPLHPKIFVYDDAMVDGKLLKWIKNP